ncbi:hypothetical protein L249_0432 [Ophiocordyceps polyrhachis-furcata BCC 54312]|uniref:Uncharacterized protein n=1 Tax=Ophiocordyceps polyrhachis-furcata BCC 54312 TaxID=1330021 RepID=A0A367LDF2_9HYPO|nr:hypothetical protein L249_0432 [Ophiocordyceps polyrhachis-furcata BCC 54312]
MAPDRHSLALFPLEEKVALGLTVLNSSGGSATTSSSYPPPEDSPVGGAPPPYIKCEKPRVPDSPEPLHLGRHRHSASASSCWHPSSPLARTPLVPPSSDMPLLPDRKGKSRAL